MQVGYLPIFISALLFSFVRCLVKYFSKTINGFLWAGFIEIPHSNFAKNNLSSLKLKLKYNPNLLGFKIQTSISKL